MSYSYTTSATDTFSLTHAKKLAAKVTADLHQCCRFYGCPSEGDIADYNEELVVMLAGEYVCTYEFGFQSNDRRVVSWYYTITAAGDLEGGRSGGLHATADVRGASWFNYMSYADAWSNLTQTGREAERAKHNITRISGHPPSDGSGHWVSDRTYVSGGVAVVRKEFRPW